MDDLQLVLVGYARFYQSIYELAPHERPEDTVLEDDQELDQWWERFVRERTRQLAKSANKSMPVSGGHAMTFAEFTPGA